MKRAFVTASLIGIILGATTFPGFAISEHEAHHPGVTNTCAKASRGMMEQSGMDMGQMPCLTDESSGSMMSMMGLGMGGMMSHGMTGMMGGGHMGMMGTRMEQMFFLDRADELGLSAEQRNKLKTLYADCRKDNIRSAAEAKIARLDLADLLPGDNWSLKDAETLVRKIKKLEGDIQVRHLQAVSDARKVLTAEQLKQVRSGGGDGNLENLFQ